LVRQLREVGVREVALIGGEAGQRETIRLVTMAPSRPFDNGLFELGEGGRRLVRASVDPLGIGK